MDALKRIIIVFALILTLLLAACGGGEGTAPAQGSSAAAGDVSADRADGSSSEAGESTAPDTDLTQPEDGSSSAEADASSETEASSGTTFYVDVTWNDSSLTDENGNRVTDPERLKPLREIYLLLDYDTMYKEHRYYSHD